jgi:hypothetical protein
VRGEAGSREAWTRPQAPFDRAEAFARWTAKLSTMTGRGFSVPPFRCVVLGPIVHLDPDGDDPCGELRDATAGGSPALPEDGARTEPEPRDSVSRPRRRRARAAFNRRTPCGPQTAKCSTVPYRAPYDLVRLRAENGRSRQIFSRRVTSRRISARLAKSFQ